MMTLVGSGGPVITNSFNIQLILKMKLVQGYSKWNTRGGVKLFILVWKLYAFSFNHQGKRFRKMDSTHAHSTRADARAFKTNAYKFTRTHKTMKLKHICPAYIFAT